MVRTLFFMLCFCWLEISRLNATPLVDASIDSTSSQAHFPLEGTLTVTHNKEEKIDPQSFVMEGKPLETSFVKDVKMSPSSDTLVSIYSFQLPAQEKGLYVLPSISVKIGGQTYQSIPSTYEVQEETAPQHAVSAQPSTPVIFRLQAGVQGPTTLYPGDRTKLIYRISYNRSVDLTRSVFPMIHPAHFQKVGDVHIQDYQLPNVTVQDLIQEVEASEIGKFSFGPSSIEGYAYTMQAGQKVYDSTLLKAEAPIVTIEVKPLPQMNQPISFTGALGKIQVEASLPSSHPVYVGDSIQLQIKIQGVTNLIELRLPLLQCQPGFSGFFQISDLPPLAEVKDKAKFFHVELRPLTSLIDQIPSIEVSSFDSSTGTYVTQHTSPIPLTINAKPLETPAIPVISLFVPIASIDKWPTPLLPPLEIEESFAPHAQLTHTWLKGNWVLWMIPIGLILLLLQNYWHRKWEQRPRPQIPKSEELFKQALKTGSLQMLEQAFWQRLSEKEIVTSGIFQLEKLPSEGQWATLHAFLFQLQALQYSSDKAFDPLQLRQTAQQLFSKI